MVLDRAFITKYIVDPGKHADTPVLGLTKTTEDGHLVHLSDGKLVIAANLNEASWTVLDSLHKERVSQLRAAPRPRNAANPKEIPRTDTLRNTLVRLTGYRLALIPSNPTLMVTSLELFTSPLPKEDVSALRTAVPCLKPMLVGQEVNPVRLFMERLAHDLAAHGPFLGAGRDGYRRAAGGDIASIIGITRRSQRLTPHSGSRQTTPVTVDRRIRTSNLNRLRAEGGAKPTCLADAFQEASKAPRMVTAPQQKPATTLHDQLTPGSGMGRGRVRLTAKRTPLKQTAMDQFVTPERAASKVVEEEKTAVEVEAVEPEKISADEAAKVDLDVDSGTDTDVDMVSDSTNDKYDVKDATWVPPASPRQPIEGSPRARPRESEEAAVIRAVDNDDQDRTRSPSPNAPSPRLVSPSPAPVAVHAECPVSPWRRKVETPKKTRLKPRKTVEREAPPPKSSDVGGFGISTPNEGVVPVTPRRVRTPRPDKRARKAAATPKTIVQEQKPDDAFAFTPTKPSARKGTPREGTPRRVMRRKARTPKTPGKRAVDE